MRTLYLILMLILTLCFGGALFAEETTQTETAKGAKGTSQPQAQTTPKPEAKKEAPPAAQPQSPPALAPAAQPALPSRPTPQLGEGTITHETKLIGGKPANLVWVEESSNSNAYTPHDARITHVADKPIPEVKEIPQAINQILFPGESCTFAGVTIQWEVNGNEMPKSETEWAPLGPLHVRGPVNRIEDIDLGLQVNSKRTLKTMSVQTMAYVDNVYVTCSSGPNQGTDARLGLYAQYIPNHQEYAPKTQTRANVYLSSVCPTSLNQWDLNLSDKPVKAADGSYQLKITARNRETGETHEAAARREASLRFGRFALKVENVCFQNRTVTFEASVEYDKTIRGRNAVLVYNAVTAASCDNKSLGEVLDHVAKECGFEVEWSGFEGFGPEAGKYVKELPVKNYFGIYSTGARGGGYTLIPVEALLQDLQKNLSNTFEPIWTDDTHLRIRPIGYEQYKKDMDAETHQQAVEERANREKEELLKALPEYRAKAMAEFEKEYALETRIYHLKAISPDAAAQLIGRQLSAYQLVEQYDLKVNREDGSVEAVSSDGTLGFHCVRRMKAGGESDKAEPLATAEETAIADPRTNSLLVTALPKTQNLVGETLGRMEDRFETEMKSVAEKAVPLRRLEVVLLQGTTNGTSETADSVSLRFGREGILSRVLVKKGQAIKAGDLLAQLGAYEIEAQQYELELAKWKESQTRLEEGQNKLKTEKSEAKSIFDDENRRKLRESVWSAREDGLKKMESESKQTEIQLKQKESQLNACQLKASADGVVTEVLVQPNEPVKAGQPILKIASPREADPSNLESARFSQEGILEQVLVKKGQTVKSGDPLARMNSQELGAQCARAEAALREKQAILDEKMNLLKIAEQKFATGTMVESDLVSARAELEKARAQLAQNELDLKMAVARQNNCELKAPADGVVAEILVQPNEPVKVGQPVLRIAPKSEAESPDARKKTETEKKAPSDSVTAAAKQYGINPDDLKFFHFTDLEERGRTILTLGETTGKEGKASADLGGGPYRCEFEYQAWRTPYLVVNALLKGPSTGEAGSEPKGLIENTLYLQEGVPSVLGITNLREGLILVVRLADSPAAPEVKPTPEQEPSNP